jgi:uncharacterized protein YacL
MTTIAPFFAWVQSSGIAATIGQSQLLTGFLSAIHLLGLALLVGSTLVSSLRLLGVILPDRPVAEVTSAQGRGIVIGLVISVVSGLLLFAPKAATAVQNGIFQIKMLLLCTAAVFYFAVYRHVARGGDDAPLQQRVAGALGVLLWLGVVSAGCAFILLE